ncbi:uncharacterized protein LOC114878266 [Osmia bicornis bicornis]|uniref:uncharacterized protein LOC114878266 n=1 Tax=Osmia bicornis bicornis TaxID=1437191 RepID=UPI0010F7D1A0|nr:uncharacterized protein LOC114878266 [Osmia bicornis bicornis]
MTKALVGYDCDGECRDDSSCDDSDGGGDGGGVCHEQDGGGDSGDGDEMENRRRHIVATVLEARKRTQSKLSGRSVQARSVKRWRRMQGRAAEARGFAKARPTIVHAEDDDRHGSR